MKTAIIVLSIFLSCTLNAYSQGHGHHGGHGGPPQARPHGNIVYRSGGPRVRTVVTLPGEAIVIRHHRVNYHYHNGYYYRPYGTSYRIIGPPVGIRVRVIPAGYYTWVVGPSTYFYFGGTYYTRIRATNEYQVIRPPVGTLVPSLPDDYDEVEMDGEVLYQLNGILYRPVTTRPGFRFEVAGYF